MGGAITTASFWKLYHAGLNIVGVVKPLSVENQNSTTPIKLYKKKWFPSYPSQELTLSDQSMKEIIPNLGIDLLETKRADHPKALQWIKKHNPTLLCVASYSHIFKEKLLQIPKKGAINFHPSLLPRYRGPNPLFWMFKESAKEAGISIHFLNKGIDTGEIIYQASLPITEGMRGRDLNNALAQLGAPLFLKATQETLNNTVKSTTQNLEEGSYHSHVTPEELQLKPLSNSAQSIYNFVRGTARWMELSYQIEEHYFSIIDAIDYSINESIPVEFVYLNDILVLKCKEGTVKLKASLKINQ